MRLSCFSRYNNSLYDQEVYKRNCTHSELYAFHSLISLVIIHNDDAPLTKTKIKITKIISEITKIS